jgi:hypothetical protein
MQRDKPALLRVASALAQAAVDTELPVLWLVAIAEIESRFNPLAVNGKSKGLMQMQEAAWNDVSKLFYLPPYNEAWSDPEWNAMAGAGYMLLTLDRLNAFGLDARKEPRWLYLAHQQGATGLNYLLQSSKGVVGERKVGPEALLRNPVPGKRPTDDPKLFYEQWMEHLARYF